MIRKIAASEPSFKTLELSSGLNILAADKSESATDKDSRNGAGKTSFVELVHFLFGARATPKSIFRSDALRNWRFEAQAEIGGKPGRVVRCGARPNSVETSGALAAETSSLQPLLLKGPPPTSVTVDAWKKVLGAQLFGLQPAPEDEPESFEPSFRSLFSYFARRQASGGFQECLRHSTDQQLWDLQVSLSWLLGLDWTISQRFQQVREREKGLKALKLAAKSGELARLARGTAELRTELTLVRAKARRMKERLEEFQVLPDYEDLEREATRITGAINDLAADNLADRGLLQELEASITDEVEPDQTDIRRVFREVGAVLPELAERRFEEVDRFHQVVLENRRAHLRAEIESANVRIEQREATKEGLDRRRREIMGMLRSGGALAEYTAMREELGRAEAKVQELTERLRDVERLETLRTELKADRVRLTRALQNDRRERDAILQQAILRFEDLSQLLYDERAGKLTIDWSENGPRFDAQIPSGQSRGIANMQIFCFDLMLMELQVERGKAPGFLIHDSHLFDGVDERQVARALQLGAQRSVAHGFQYIVTLNTDALPQEGFDTDFNVEDYFIDVRLTDAGADGGLFGIRFDWPRSRSATNTSDLGSEQPQALLPS